MGALLSVCGLGQLACCAGSSLCGLFSCCGSATSPRFMYSFFLLLVTILGWLMGLPSVSDWLKSWIPYCWGHKNAANQTFSVLDVFIKKDNASTVCDQFTGYLAVYRLMFATCMFFLVFAFLMIRVRSKSDPRFGLHNGMWPIKFLLLIGCIVAASFIPFSQTFSVTWEVFGLIGAFLFMLIQFYLINAFADDLALSWSETLEEGGWYLARVIITSLANIIGSITAFVLFYVYYGGNGCGLHNFLISINLFVCVLLCIVSILPIVQQELPHSGLIQSSIMALYIVFLTWSALNNSPVQECKPTWMQTKDGDTSLSRDNFISLLICFGCILYSVIRISNYSDDRDVEILPHDGESANEAPVADENFSSYPKFYLILALGTLYLMMVLTNWYSPDQSYSHFGESTSSLWIKMSSSWLCASMYVWILVAPILLPDRDFGRN